MLKSMQNESKYLVADIGYPDSKALTPNFACGSQSSEQSI